MCSPPRWEPFQLHPSSLAEGWDNTACWATGTQPSSRAQPGLHSMDLLSMDLLSASGGLSAPGPSSAKPFLTLLETDKLKTDTDCSQWDVCFLFSSPTEAFTWRVTWPWPEIHIKAEELCESPLSGAPLQASPFLSRKSPGVRIGGPLSTAQDGMRARSVIGLGLFSQMMPTRQPHSGTSCGKICQDCCLSALDLRCDYIAQDGHY